MDGIVENVDASRGAVESDTTRATTRGAVSSAGKSPCALTATAGGGMCGAARAAWEERETR